MISKINHSRMANLRLKFSRKRIILSLSFKMKINQNLLQTQLTKMKMTQSSNLLS
jgi:hypothetical protein